MNKDYTKIERRILSLSKYIKEISTVTYNKKPFIFIYPDFEKLKESNIINIREELYWYAIELYNIGKKREDRVENYKILSTPIPRDASGSYDKEFLKRLIDAEAVKESSCEDVVYSRNCIDLISYLSDVSQKNVSLNSHIELDLELDSINYVELFLYIEQSFGVIIDEVQFAKLMLVKELCQYIDKHHKFSKKSRVSLSKALKEPFDKKLKYSPLIMYIYKVFLSPLFKIYFSLELRGEENIPDRSCIFAPSHQSMLDGFLILSTLPFHILKKTSFLAYKQVFGKGILKPIAEHSQNILIDSNEKLLETLQYSALTLKEKNNIVIFPEGARSRDRKLLEFKPFFAILSKTFNVPVIPVVIDGSFEALKTGSYFPRPKKIKVKYLDAIYPQSLSIEEIIHRTKSAIDEEMMNDPIK